MAKRASKGENSPRPKSNGKFGAYVFGFFLGVISTVLFFYFDGWDYFARQGDKVERRVRQGVSDAGTKAQQKSDHWIDSNFDKPQK